MMRIDLAANHRGFTQRTTDRPSRRPRSPEGHGWVKAVRPGEKAVEVHLSDENSDKGPFRALGT